MMTGLAIGMDGGGWFMAITVVGSVIAVAWLLISLSRGDQSPAVANPKTVLDERFARGEIDVNQYEQARRLLTK